MVKVTQKNVSNQKSIIFADRKKGFRVHNNHLQ